MRASARLAAALLIMGLGLSTGRVRSTLGQEEAESDLLLRIEAAPPGSPEGVRIGFENHTDGDVVLLRPCDGSAEGMRMPHYIWQVVDDAGRPAPWRSRGRCGNVNPLQEEDFMVLRAGQQEQVALGWLGEPADRFAMGPGTYRVRLTYRMDRGVTPEDRPGSGIPSYPSPRARELLDAAWVGERVSNEIEIRVPAR